MEPVASAHFPYLPLQLQVDESTSSIEGLLDTGFDGDLTIPPDLDAEGTLSHDYLSWTLADDSSVTAPVYIGLARISSLATFPVLVTALGNEPLIGRGVSDRYRITLDHGQRVIVEP